MCFCLDGVSPIARFIDDIMGQLGVDTLTSDIDSSGPYPNYSGTRANIVASNGTNGLPGGSYIQSAPLLYGLTDNGGPTETMATQAGSPAILAGVSQDYPPAYNMRSRPTSVGPRGGRSRRLGLMNMFRRRRR